MTLFFPTTRLNIKIKSRFKDIALQAVGSKHWREEGKEGVEKRREGGSDEWRKEER